MIGIDASVANAFRRILIAELPSMVGPKKNELNNRSYLWILQAIEKVHVTENSSVLPDDVLAHRLGLIPLRADARLFVEKNPTDTRERDDDTLVFKLKVACKKNPKAVEGNEDPKNLYIDSNGRRINLWQNQFFSFV